MANDEWGTRSDGDSDRSDDGSRYDGDDGRFDTGDDRFDQTQSDDTSWGEQPAATGDGWDEPSATDSQVPTAGRDEPEQHGPEPSGRWIAAVIGAAASFTIGVVVSFIPIVGGLLGLAGTLVGGGVAGYLRGSDTKESALTGALAGVLVTLPFVLLLAVVMLFFGAMFVEEIAMAGFDGGLFFLVFGVFVMVGVAINAVLSAIGGAIGAMVTDRRPPN